MHIDKASQLDRPRRGLAHLPSPLSPVHLDAADLEGVGDLGEDGLQLLVLVRQAVSRISNERLAGYEREDGLGCGVLHRWM